MVSINIWIILVHIHYQNSISFIQEIALFFWWKIYVTKWLFDCWNTYLAEWSFMLGASQGNLPLPSTEGCCPPPLASPAPPPWQSRHWTPHWRNLILGNNAIWTSIKHSFGSSPSLPLRKRFILPYWTFANIYRCVNVKAWSKTDPSPYLAVKTLRSGTKLFLSWWGPFIASRFPFPLCKWFHHH